MAVSSRNAPAAAPLSEAELDRICEELYVAGFFDALGRRLVILLSTHNPGGLAELLDYARTITRKGAA
jgi:hypothetical protein